MKRVRVIPILLLRAGGVVKSIQFKRHVYIGDPINAVKVFNDKGVDEICILDIDATVGRRAPNLDLIRDIASEAFMPLSYGGGLRTVSEMRGVMQCGVEKLVVNSAAYADPRLISEAAEVFGSQSVVVAIDASHRKLGGYRSYHTNGTKSGGLSPAEHAANMATAGAGEIILTSIDRDGTMSGYDLPLISSVSKAVDIPVVACGGAANVADFARAVQSGASAVAAGSMFVFVGAKRAVLINYPNDAELQQLFDAA